ncbi:TPA: hypothetical protein ACH9M1_005052 [Escherichia coli]
MCSLLLCNISTGWCD